MAKRRNGDGSFRELKNGTIDLAVTVELPDGSTDRKRFYGKSTKEARAKYEQWLRTGSPIQKNRNSWIILLIPGTPSTKSRLSVPAADTTMKCIPSI